MAATAEEQTAAFGRRVAAAQGYDTDSPDIDWLSYGRAAQYQIGKGRSVPDPAQYRAAPVRTVPVKSGHNGTPPPSPPPDEHVVRIGRIEVRSAAQRPEARNRPRRAIRRGERTTGYYRIRRPELSAALRAHDELRAARTDSERRERELRFREHAARAHRAERRLERQRRRAWR